MIKNKLIAGISLMLASAGAFAEEKSEQVDPSDVTQANTQGSIGVSNKGDVKLLGSFSQQFEGGSAAMVLLEGTMDKAGGYKDSRVQYFHVFDTGSGVIPRIGTSLDIIDNNNFSTAAFGAVSVVKTPIDSVSFYFRGAGLVGRYKDDGGIAQKYNITDTDVSGAMGAIYLAWTPMEDGTSILAWPEYTKMNGSVNIESVKTTVAVNVPLTTGADKWLQFKFENTDMDVTHNGITESTTDRVFWTNFKMYF